jgi:DNA adenine methylase
MRPALKWYGGKNKIAQWVTSHFPFHTCYVEPYGGAASVLLNKTPATHEVYNDLDDELVNFFRILRSEPARLIHLIELTPYSRLEHELAWETCQDSLERARRFYVRCWQSYGSGTRNTAGAAGWLTQKGKRRGTTAVENWRDTHHLYEIADRLLSVQIEKDTALNVLHRFDTRDTLFYVDPPYVASTRNKKKVYQHEMTNAEHIELAQCLQDLNGMIVLSGYESSLYDDLYENWQKVTTNTTDRTSNSVQECLWLSPGVSDLRHLPMWARLAE